MMSQVCLTKPRVGAPCVRRGGAIRFTTRNSTYLFTWVHAQPVGVLVCLAGTFAGDVVSLDVEPFRDLAWPGERVDIPGYFTSTVITSVDRGASS